MGGPHRTPSQAGQRVPVGCDPPARPNVPPVGGDPVSSTVINRAVVSSPVARGSCPHLPRPDRLPTWTGTIDHDPRRQNTNRRGHRRLHQQRTARERTGGNCRPRRWESAFRHGRRPPNGAPRSPMSRGTGGAHGRWVSVHGPRVIIVQIHQSRGRVASQCGCWRIPRSIRPEQVSAASECGRGCRQSLVGMRRGGTPELSRQAGRGDVEPWNAVVPARSAAPGVSAGRRAAPAPGRPTGSGRAA
jgi:hypothetical protein